MKFLQLTAILVLSSFTIAQNVPQGAFSSLHVQTDDPQEYIDYLKENTEAFEAIGSDMAGVCVTRTGNSYTGEMFVWNGFSSMAEAMKGGDLYDPATAPRALQKLREVKYSTFWKPLKDFPIRPSSFERLNRIKIARENLNEYMATAIEFEKAVRAEGNDFNLGIFQPFGGGYSEQDYHVRGSHANSEEAGEIIDRGYAGAASTALYLKLLSLAEEVVTDTYESCQVIYTAE
jgi:hypothetical protein|tara:strand:- start:21 stop:716 length:696 start_codon:yes stop_codon:yes gene_type:complete